MNRETRIDLWNAFYNSIWGVLFTALMNGRSIAYDFCGQIWMNYFKREIDRMESNPNFVTEQYRKIFIDYDWNRIFDFIEFVLVHSPNIERLEQFRKLCNDTFENNFVAYRITVNNLIVEITSEEELKEINTIFKDTIIPDLVKTHISTAIKLLSDRANPDYRNSMKESISAVESICKKITKNEKATLGQALNEISKTIPIHTALKGSFEKLYGYTNDADGIRHGMSDETTVGFEDANFFLVACSAFVNYLKEKAIKANISF